MTSRILPPAEWARLAGTLLEKAWPHLNAATDRVFVVEDGAAIVGCAAVFSAWHLEGAWIAPSHRGRVSVGRHLFRAACRAVRDVGAREVFTMAVDDVGRSLSERIGTATHLDCDHFAVDMNHVMGRT